MAQPSHRRIGSRLPSVRIVHARLRAQSCVHARPPGPQTCWDGYAAQGLACIALTTGPRTIAQLETAEALVLAAAETSRVRRGTYGGDHAGERRGSHGSDHGFN